MGNPAGGQATNQANATYNQASTQLAPVEGMFSNQYNTALGRQSDLYNQALAGFQNQQTTGGYDPTQLANMRSTLATWMPQGGLDPTQLAQTQAGYGAMAQTGGFDPAARSQFMNQATSGQQALIGSLSGAAQRSGAATGGNIGAALGNIARTGGEQLAAGTTGAATALNQAINQNKLAGLAGQAGVNAQLASARQGALGLQSGLESGVAGGVQAANRGIQGMFDTQTGQINAAGNQLLSALGLQFGTQQQATNALVQLSRNPGLFQTILGDVIGAGGAAAGAAAGLGVKV
jgi:hypothetical protein